MGDGTSTAIIFGGVLKRFRTERGVSQEALAEAADLHGTYVSLLERGRNQPSLDVILRIARSLGVRAVDLVGEVEKELQERSPE
jgi:transcriptional regulator with XRE-family HTH domain